jgi:hypothetical protein
MIITKLIKWLCQLTYIIKTFNKLFNIFYNHIQKYNSNLKNIYNIDKTDFAIDLTVQIYDIVDKYYRCYSHESY